MKQRCFVKKQFFNEVKFKKAVSYIETNPIIAKDRFEEYLREYPMDYVAYSFYATLLINLKLFDEAKEMLKFAKNVVIRDSSYTSEKRDRFSLSVLFPSVCLMIREKRYKECLEFMEAVNITSVDTGYNAIYYYCKKELKILKDVNRDAVPYLFGQIYDYQESEFLDHVRKHLAEYNKDTDEPNSSIFASNFPFSNVFLEIKKYIPSDKGIFHGIFEEMYIFRYDHCGRCNNKVVDFFKVICFQGTNHFITMCPSSYCEKLPYIDLNYLQSSHEKCKRLSQIDKFYQRYPFNK